MLWDYIHHLIDSWDSECVILGDFNEVCHEEESSWKKAACMESNAIVKLKKKLQFLKCSIKQWVKEDKTNANATKLSIQSRLSNLDKTIDQGRGTNDTVNDRPNLLKELHDLNSFTSLDLAQKEKIHWAIEGDENSKYFYGIINKKRSQMAIRGVLAEGEWMVEPAMVKREFLDHFSNGFATLISPKNFIQSQFPKCLSLYQNEIFERIATYDEIKKAVRWDFLDEVLHKFGFGDKWRGCLSSSMGSILVNDSPTSEFQFHKGLKKGDPLSHFLFILIMESLHVSFENVLTTGLYKGIRLDDSLSLSHLFYADDVVFVGKWDKLKFSTIVNVLKWFFMASGLKINIHKSKLMGIGIPQDVVASTANSIGCAILTSPFNYLRVKVGGNMSRLISWDEVIAKISSRLSKWKLKTLSIGGRYTLTKPVLSSLPLHYFSIFKVPKGILNKMESFRRNFFNGVDISENKMSLIGWKHILASKKNGGLGISSLFALNRAILFKWICHFITNGSSLWSRVIKAFYGNRGAIDIIHNSSRRNGEETSFWDDVWTSDLPLKLMFLRLYSLELDKTCSVAIKVRDTSLIASFRRAPRGGIEVDQLRLLGDIISPISKNNNKCEMVRLWLRIAHKDDTPIRSLISTGRVWGSITPQRGAPIKSPTRIGAGLGITLVSGFGDGDGRPASNPPRCHPYWLWRLDSVKSARCYIDDSFLPKVEVSTRWIVSIPIKVNIFAWKVCLDKLPTRLNLSIRGLDIQSILCPNCYIAVESTAHILFSCDMAR
ncbi:RNA-directed DNA polymerase, eukaryota [Tanacetum coccineum]